MSKISELLEKINTPEEEKKPLELSEEQSQFLRLFLERYSLLEDETAERIAQYLTYDDFVSGDQWGRLESRKKQGRNEMTANLCEQTVRKFTSLLMNEMPRVVVPRESEIAPIFDIKALSAKPGKKKKFKEEDTELPVEFNRSEAIEKILRRVFYIDNNVQKEWYDGAFNGSKLGDTIFYIYWDVDGKKVKLENVFPGHVRLGFATNDPRDIEYAVFEKVMSVTEIKRRYGYDATPETVDIVSWNPTQFLKVPSAKVKYYWDKEVHGVFVNDLPITEAKKHNYGRVPFFLIPNRSNGKVPWGESDLKDIISIQEEYNMAISDEADIVKIYADPKVLVFNPGKTNLKHFAASGAKVIPVSKDALVKAFQFDGNVFPTQGRVERIKRDYHNISGLPEIAFGSTQGSIVTGVAMTAQFAPVLQLIRMKILNWNVGLSDMAYFILDLLEKFGGKEPTTGIDYKTIIAGWRYCDWQWGAKMPRDDSIYITNELSKLNARVQSRSRTMINLGVPSPQDELTQIAYEENNPTLSPRQAVETQAVKAKAGLGDEQKMAALAQQENEVMTSGRLIPSVGRNATEHQLHLQVHGDYVKNQDLPPEILEIIDTHMQGHEQALATGGRGGTRAGAGRPERVNLQAQVTGETVAAPQAETPNIEPVV